MLKKLAKSMGGYKNLSVITMDFTIFEVALRGPEKL